MLFIPSGPRHRLSSLPLSNWLGVSWIFFPEVTFDRLTASSSIFSFAMIPTSGSLHTFQDALSELHSLFLFPTSAPGSSSLLTLMSYALVFFCFPSLGNLTHSHGIKCHP